MKRFNLWGLLPITILLAIIIFFEYKGRKERDVLYREGLDSKITEISNNWTGGRSYDYLTEAGVIITLLNSDTLQIGDSIHKRPNSSVFYVHRKANNKYEFYKAYNVSK